MISDSNAEKREVNERGRAMGARPDCLVVLAWVADSLRHACTRRLGIPTMKILCRSGIELLISASVPSLSRLQQA